VLIDFDADPLRKRLRGRVGAVAVGLLVALAGGAVWLSSSAIPASPASRELVATAPPPSATSPSVRTTRPTVAPRAPVAKRPARVKRPPLPPLEPAFLSVNAIPWGSVYLDGRPVGNTPQINLQVAAGPHRLRVERDGYRPYDRVIDVASGQRLRITDIALAERDAR
jgi:hypothetical protein